MTDVLALREALVGVCIYDRACHEPRDERGDAIEDATPEQWAAVYHTTGCIRRRMEHRARLGALIAAVRAETLAGSGVVEVCEQVSEGWPCGQTRDRHDGAYISHPYQPATPPTPVLTAARCGYLIRMLGLTPFICNRAEDDALHRSRTHPDAHAFLATPDPEATDG